MSAGIIGRATIGERVVRVAGACLALAALIALATGIPALAKPLASSVAPRSIAAIVPAAVDPDLYLCASAGTVTMPDGEIMAIWGFSLDSNDEDPAGCDPAQIPGPVLGVDTVAITAGDLVNIHLTNDLAVDVSLSFPGQVLGSLAAPVPPGTSVVPALQDATTTPDFTFTASAPGTYLYQAIDTRQVLMGLYGALIVNPTTAGRAYDDASTAYDTQATLVLSEIDPGFNANPSTFDLVDYAPVYWLINGEAHPDTDAISAASGDALLLRYVNAGSLPHTMALLGTHQRLIAKDAFPTAYAVDVVSETIAAGQTLDAITVPCGDAGSEVALYNSNLRLTNGDLSSSPHEPGGMQTVIELSAGICPVAGNIAPSVNAGPDQTVTATALPATVVLDGTVNDDFVTPVTATWSGPGVIASVNDVDTTVSFAAAGAYVLTLEADDGVNLVDTDTVTVTVTPPVLLYFSTEGTTNLPVVTGEDDADIYAWHGGSSYSRIFDASTNGVLAAADVDGLVVVDGDTFYMSFLDDTTLAGSLLVADEDIALFDAGTWSLVFDGSDVGLSEGGNAEDVDAFEILGAGVIAISTEGNPDVGLPGGERDEDLLRCTGTFGATTSCTWSYYMDGSDVGLGNGGEDVDGAAVRGGEVSLTTEGPQAFSVTGASGEDEDVFVCGSLTPGTTSSCPGGWSLFFDGSASGLLAGEDLDAIDRP